MDLDIQLHQAETRKNDLEKQHQQALNELKVIRNTYFT